MGKAFVRAQKKIIHTPRVMGIMGTCPGVGVTHFALLMANYLTGVPRQKTAFLEWKSQKTVEQIGRICKEGPSLSFTLQKVDYYANITAEELSRIMQKTYAFIIVDFGDYNSQTWTEFQRCDRKYLLSSLSEWQIHTLMELVGHRGREGLKSCTCLVSFGSEESRSEVMRNLAIPFTRIPYSLDPFTITGEDMLFFQSIL